MNLQQEFELLSASFIDTSNEWEYHSGLGKTELESLYMMRIGNYQLQLLEIQLEIRSIQRKTEEINRCINRNEQPSLAVINAQILVEMAEFYEQINATGKQITEAKLFLLIAEPVKNEAELKKCYRELAKKLHPDLTAASTAERKMLWEKVVNAYNSGNLDELQSISIVYADVIEDQASVFSDTELQQKNEHLKRSIKRLNSQLQHLYESFPYSHEQKIRDENWIVSERNRILENIDLHRTALEDAREKYQQLVNGL